MTLRLAMMGSTSQVATHSPAFHSTIHGYNNDVSEGIPTLRSAPVANATDPGSNLISLVVHNDRTFDKDKDNKLANPAGRTLIDVVTEDQCMQLQALNGEADSAEWITKQNEVLDDSGHGKSIDSTLIHGDNQVMPPQPDAFGQQPKSQSSANTTWNNKSELKLRQVPSWLCLQKNLTRHTRTVHGENLEGKTYICTNGHCAKDNPPKKWPRADNFCAHLKRVHKIHLDSAMDLQHYAIPSESIADGEQPSELRKHSKRHEKPYRCTVYQCEKTFGSKDDWKRHENQQHTPPEIWVCEKAYRMVFGSRDQFKLHLEDLHHEMSPPSSEAKLEHNKQNIHSASSFWCGFCRCLVPIGSDTSDPQDVRFDHIDDHFMGRRDQPKRNISQWLHMEILPTERDGQAISEQSRQCAERKPNAAYDARPPKQLRSRIV
ncbi:hypothetical protein V2G26_007227 [Clonostachys chloroleuca]